MTAAQFYDAWGQRVPARQTGQTWPSDLQWAGGWGYQTGRNNGPSEPGIGLDCPQERYGDRAIRRSIPPDPTAS